MKKILVWLYTGLVLGNIATANATVIVDTGPGPSTGGGFTLWSGQSLGAEFSTGQAYTITDIEGWIGSTGCPLCSGPVTATLAVYNNVSSLPGVELFSSGFTVGDSTAWYGATGLDWLLDAGTYWVTFEVRPGDTLHGYMPFPSPSPLANGAYNQGGGWVSSPNLDIGVRISAVPEPATIVLMSLGLAGLGFSRRKHTP